MVGWRELEVGREEPQRRLEDCVPKIPSLHTSLRYSYLSAGMLVCFSNETSEVGKWVRLLGGSRVVYTARRTVAKESFIGGSYSNFSIPCECMRENHSYGQEWW